VLRLSQPCWVQAIGDGRLLTSATLQPGRPVLYLAHRVLVLVLGSAGAVDLRVNGRSVATGSLGQVMRLEFRWRRGRLVSKVV